MFHIVSCRVMSCRIVARRFAIYGVLSCHTVSSRVLSFLIGSYRVFRIVSRHILPYRAVSYRGAWYCIVSYPVVSWCIASYPVVSSRVVSYCIVSYRVISRHILSHSIVSCHIVSYPYRSVLVPTDLCALARLQIEYEGDSTQVTFLRLFSRRAYQNVTYHCRNSEAWQKKRSIKLLGDNDMEFHAGSASKLRPTVVSNDCQVSSSPRVPLCDISPPPPPLVVGPGIGFWSKPMTCAWRRGCCTSVVIVFRSPKVLREFGKTLATRGNYWNSEQETSSLRRMCRYEVKRPKALWVQARPSTSSGRVRMGPTESGLRDLALRQNENTLWRQLCVLRCCPSVAKRGNIVARRADTRNVSEDFQKHFMCPPQMLRAW